MRITSCTQVQSPLLAWWSTCVRARKRKRKRKKPGQKPSLSRPDAPTVPRKSTTKTFGTLHTFFSLSVALSLIQGKARFISITKTAKLRTGWMWRGAPCTGDVWCSEPDSWTEHTVSLLPHGTARRRWACDPPPPLHSILISSFRVFVL